MLNIDLSTLEYHVYFNSNKNNSHLISIKTLLEGMSNIQVDPKKKGVYYKKDFYEIVCKKIFNSLKRNHEFQKNINTKFVLHTLRNVDALLLIETNGKIICGFATLNFFPDINIVHTQLVGFNCDIKYCRKNVLDFLPKFSQNINMMHLTFGALLLQIGD
jgi:hypothetical protein